MDHDTTLANAGSAKKGQTFDNTHGSNAFEVESVSLDPHAQMQPHLSRARKRQISPAQIPNPGPPLSFFPFRPSFADMKSQSTMMAEKNPDCDQRVEILFNLFDCNRMHNFQLNLNNESFL